MTREMNKPDWHSKWLEKHTEFLTAEKLPTTLNTGSIQGQRMIIDEDIAKFMDELNRRLSECG